MSGIVLFRIDERLVHGQVVTAWLGHTQAEEIFVLDDATAQDSLLRSVVKMAVPSHIDVQVASLEEAEELLAELDPEAKVMVVVKHPENARKVLEQYQGEALEINMGNAGMAAGRSKLSSSVYLAATEVEELRRIESLGHAVYLQTVPGTERKSLSEALL
jgi:mannose/fructose/N-acetylgalactosamine-specific phosphotransferase system component IIB